MTRVALCRRAARALVAAAVWISPANMREWAAAMAAESEYVEGSFGALAWAAGCFGTALKQLCISILSPGALAAETEGNMSRFAKISVAVLIVASALFLFAPTFRQGVRLTASSWHPSDAAWLAKMRALGAIAEKNHDAKTLAFVALQLNGDWATNASSAATDRALRDRYANEAVKQQPRLTWIYYPILSRDRSPETRDPSDVGWTTRLEAWDPNNAAVYAREASFCWPRGVTGLNPQSDRAILASSPHWLKAMEEAFSATEYDSYVSRKSALDVEVSRTYGIYDPDRMLTGIAFYPVFENANYELYAKDFLLAAGEGFEGKGNFALAEQSYWEIAHLGEMIQLQGNSDVDSLMGIELQLIAGTKLQGVFEKTGNTSAARLVAYQTALARQSKSDFLSRHRWANREAELAPFEAWTVQFSLLGMVIALAFILCSAGYFAVHASFAGKGVRSSRFSSLALVGTVLLFASAIGMYFGFAPYAAAFRNYLAGPSQGNAFAELARFGFLQGLPSEVCEWFWSSSFETYFWYTVIAVGAAIVVWILYRYLMRTFRHSAPMQPAE